MLKLLWHDEAGVILSAELVLIMTLLVIGLIVGLSELQDSVVNELNDVGEAIGSLNQSFFFHGQSSFNGQVKSFTRGSFFVDRTDNCDGNECAISCDAPVPEVPKVF
jgi:Flp pilus assembly pilin Flp